VVRNPIALVLAATALVTLALVSWRSASSPSPVTQPSGPRPSDASAAASAPHPRAKAAKRLPPVPDHLPSLRQTEPTAPLPFDPNDPPTDPAAPNYSAHALVQAGYRAAEIFSREPVTEPWASEREAAIGAVLADRIKTNPNAGARVSTVECRTDTCYVELEFDSWDAMQAELVRLLKPMFGHLYVSDGWNPTTGGHYVLRRYVFFMPGYRDRGTYEGWLDLQVSGAASE
jgi:hypothetical protein